MPADHGRRGQPGGTKSQIRGGGHRKKERRAVAAATEQAKAFRDKLEAAGISYHELMALEQAHEDLGNMAHNILLGWENGEGFPHE